jgi:hypothetical protein
MTTNAKDCGLAEQQRKEIPTMKRPRTAERRAAAALLCSALTLQPMLARAASDDDIAALKQAIEKLQTENRNLARRLGALETEKSARKPSVTHPEPSAAVAQRKPEPETTQETQPTPNAASTADLERRVKDLEITKTAQEDSVRTIIRNSLSKSGSKINEFVTLGGAIEVTGGRASDFSGQKMDSVQLSTAELDLDIKVNDWSSASFIIQYDTGTNVQFPTAQTFNTGIDRFIVDRAAVTIGDIQRFPLYAKFGRDVLSYGTSTGVHRADVLSVENPLTIEVFETRANSIGFGFALPTPAAGPPPPGVIVPPVRPLVINPAFSAFAKGLGYQPTPVRPKALTPTPPTPELPPFYGSFDVYDATTVNGINRKFGSSFNGRIGYQTSGHCGRPYDELKDSFVCPWAFDVSVDYISSVFDSLFLGNEYSNFINQFGQIPGMAVDFKMNFGPMLLVAEYDTAIKTAQFVDDTPRRVRIAPSSWQVALAYQFAWNPWVETIGGQGNYIAVGYSRSHDLAGVTQATTGGPTRVGFVPESRLTVTAAEWVLEGLKIAVEYSHNWDYSTAKGGTGRQADGILLDFTYQW